jgi:predicted methyltransferase
MEDRIALQKGDWNEDEFGEGYDCLLMGNILHGAGSQADMKLAKAFRALSPGGLLIVHDFLLHNDASGPLPAALFNINVGAYTISEILSVIRAAGFREASLIAYNAQRGSGLITAARP